MENEIKVNEYVRTKKHGIFKVETIRKTPYGHLCGTTDNERVPTFTIGKGGTAEIKKDIVKHSPNLIDLIQCGDYVNGEKVEKIAEPSLANDHNRLIYCNECEGLYELILFNKDIKEIVTKEMMESISYKVTKM